MSERLPEGATLGADSPLDLAAISVEERDTELPLDRLDLQA